MAVLLDEAVGRLRDQIDGGKRRLALQAAPGAGKTTVLAGLAASLAGSRHVVRVALPDADDAAQVALVEAAAQLRFAMPDVLDRVVPAHEPARVPWSARLDAVREALSRAGDQTVILFDEPRFDPGRSPESRLFAGRAVELTQALMDSSGTVVLAGTRIPPGVAPDAGVDLPLVIDPEDAAFHVIARVMEQAPPRSPLPPIVVQVLLAMRSAGIDIQRIPRRDLRLNHLLDHDLGRLFLDRAEMRRVVARLSVLRVPFSSALLDRAGFSALSEQDRGVVDRLLTPVRDDGRSMPAALSSAIRSRIAMGDPAWTPDEQAAGAHRFAAEHHHARFEEARTRGDVAAAIREELEEIHHLTEAGDASALLDRSLQFVEQYDALGKSLSLKALGLKALRAPKEQEEKLRRDAVRAYERALEHDARDAYAHHYIAYNLDILALERERVDREYVTARDLDPRHPWYHGRHICFLITTAWTDRARKSWEKALTDLAGTGDELDATVYEELHRQVARLLLARSSLDFAREVLEDVPETLRHAPWWIALDQLRRCLEEDRDQRLLFPPILAIEKRWEGPHLASSGPDAAGITRWQPGRVLGRDEDLVLIDVARGQQDISTIEVEPHELLEEWSVSPSELRAGAFVELVEYEDGTKKMNVWDRRSSSFSNIPNLPGLFPAPDRYIRRAFA